LAQILPFKTVLFGFTGCTCIELIDSLEKTKGPSFLDLEHPLHLFYLSTHANHKPFSTIHHLFFKQIIMSNAIAINSTNFIHLLHHAEIVPDDIRSLALELFHEDGTTMNWGATECIKEYYAVNPVPVCDDSCECSASLSRQTKATQDPLAFNFLRRSESVWRFSTWNPAEEYNRLFGWDLPKSKPKIEVTPIKLSRSLKHHQSTKQAKRERYDDECLRRRAILTSMSRNNNLYSFNDEQ
jgi:hypothetical protein